MVPVICALASADVSAGTASAARIAIIAITTSNSIRGNAGEVLFIFIVCGKSGAGYLVLPRQSKDLFLGSFGGFYLFIVLWNVPNKVPKILVDEICQANAHGSRGTPIVVEASGMATADCIDRSEGRHKILHEVISECEASSYRFQSVVRLPPIARKSWI